MRSASSFWFEEQQLRDQRRGGQALQDDDEAQTKGEVRHLIRQRVHRDLQRALPGRAPECALVPWAAPGLGDTRLS